MNNTITKEYVQAIMAKSTFQIEMYGNKTTVVVATLPNGFIIVESSSCVDPQNYNHDLGEKLCKERIKDKIWAFEGYLLQTRIALGQGGKDG